jgi:hypothetical protein
MTSGTNTGVELTASEADVWAGIVDELQTVARATRRVWIVAHAVRWCWAYARGCAMARGIDIGRFGEGSPGLESWNRRTHARQ